MPEQRTGSTSPLEQLNWTEQDTHGTELCSDLGLPTLTKIFNPLPLQCLAAEALPENVKKDIENVTNSSINEMDEQTSSETAKSKLNRAKKDEPVEHYRGYSVIVPLQYFKNGSGLRLVGGVHCSDSDEVHAQIVVYKSSSEKLEETAQNKFLRNGLCVLEFEGTPLQNCTFEEVCKLLKLTTKALVKLTVRDCRCQQSDTTRGRSRTCIERDTKPDETNFLSLRREKKANRRFRPKHLALSPQPRSDSPSPSVNSSISSDAERIPVEASPTPVVEAKPLGDKATSETKSDDLDLPYVTKGPNGMAKISLRYNKGEEMLYICIYKLKRRTSVTTEQSGIFINTTIMPDKEFQGIKHGKVVHSKLSTEEILESSASYRLPSDEVYQTSLRVSVWESTRKKPIFRGEVFFHLNDSHIVNLQAVAKWYPICDPDPNLPPLPTPFHKQATLFNKMKASLTSPFGSNNNTLRKKKFNSPSKAQSLMDIAQTNEILAKNDLHSILAPLKDDSGSSPNSKRLSFIEFLSELNEGSHDKEPSPAPAVPHVSHTRSLSSQIIGTPDGSVKSFGDNISVCSEGAATYTSEMSFVDFLSSFEATQSSSRPNSEISQDSFLTTSSGTDSSSRSSVQGDGAKDYTKYGDEVSESSLTLLNYWSSPKRYTAKLIRKYSFIDTLEEMNHGSSPSRPHKSPSPQATPTHSVLETSPVPTNQEKSPYDRLPPKININGFPLYKCRRGSVDTITTSNNKYHGHLDHPLSVTNSYHHGHRGHSPCRSPLASKKMSAPKKDRQFYKAISKSVDDIVGMDDSSLMEFEIGPNDYTIQKDEIQEDEIDESSLDTPGMRRALMRTMGRDEDTVTTASSSTETTETNSNLSSEVFIDPPTKTTSSDETPSSSPSSVMKRHSKSQSSLNKPSFSKRKFSPKFAQKWMSMEALIESDSSPETEKREKVLPALALRMSEGQYGTLKKLQEAYESGKHYGSIYLKIVGKAIASTLSIQISNIIFYNERLMNTDYLVKVKLYNRFNEECELSDKGQMSLHRKEPKQLPSVFEFSGNPSVYYLQVTLKLSSRVIYRKPYHVWVDLQKALSSSSENSSWYDIKA